jgi:hypothetical protein
MKYTVKAVNKGKGVTSYEIYDDRGRDVGRAVRQGARGVFQIEGHAPVKFTRNNVAAAINDWANNIPGEMPRSLVSKKRAVDMYKSNIEEGDVVKHKFGLKQQQKNKTKYRFYQEIKDDIPVYDRGTHSAVLPKYIENHRHPENLEPFDHFEVQPSVSGVNGRMLGITKDGMKVFFAASRLETAKALVDAYNRGGFSDLDIEKVPLEPTESRRPSAALAGIAEAEKELSPWNFKKRTNQEIALRKAKGTEKHNQQRLARTKDARSTFDEIEDRVLEIVGQSAYTSKDPHDIERVENVRLAVKRTLKRADPNIDREGRALSKLERSVEVRRRGSTGYKDF